MGPNMITNNAFPIKCHPNAAGNFSIVQYSETVNVKLASAAPRKKPQTESQTTNGVHSVCSATTENQRIIKVIDEFHIFFKENIIQKVFG